jgi:hypothetical protein
MLPFAGKAFIHLVSVCLCIRDKARIIGDADKKPVKHKAAACPSANSAEEGKPVANSSKNPYVDEAVHGTVSWMYLMHRS